jgi:hypothetical protein
MTKAHLKDGAVDHAIKFFENEVTKLGDIKAKREDFLLTMFDTVYGEVQGNLSKLTLEEYQNLYIDMIQISTNCVKESFAVSQLSRVIKDKDFNEIETLFSLYLVQKQETAIYS